MKKIAAALLLVAIAVYAWVSLPSLPSPQGEGASGGHANHGGDPAALTDGVVVAMNRPARSLTISHGPMANLGMPAMTMGFEVADPALLEGIRPGDKVRFHADVVGGAFTVMKIERAD